MINEEKLKAVLMTMASKFEHQEKVNNMLIQRIDRLEKDLRSHKNDTDYAHKV